MVDVDTIAAYRQTSGPRLGPKVSGHSVLFCIHQRNQVNYEIRTDSP